MKFIQLFKNGYVYSPCMYIIFDVEQVLIEGEVNIVGFTVPAVILQVQLDNLEGLWGRE